MASTEMTGDSREAVRRDVSDNEEHSTGSARVRTATRRSIGLREHFSIERIELSRPRFGRAIAFMGIESTF